MRYYGNYRGYVLRNDTAHRDGKLKVWVPQLHDNLYEQRIKVKKVHTKLDNQTLVDDMTKEEVEALAEVLPWASIAQPLIGGSSSGTYGHSGGQTVGDGYPTIDSEDDAISRFNFLKGQPNGDTEVTTYSHDASVDKFAGADKNTRELLGNSNNQLRVGSIALNKSLRDKLNPKKGDQIYYQDRFIGYFDDTSPQPNNNLDIFFLDINTFPNAGVGDRTTINSSELSVRSGQGTIPYNKTTALALKKSGISGLGGNLNVTQKPAEVYKTPANGVSSTYTTAERYLGVKEITGKGANPTILAWLQNIDGNQFDDETAWCSAFVNAIASELGLPQSGALNARSWLKVGQGVSLENAQLGDVVVLWRGSRSSWKGHVGFFAGVSGNNIKILGGNQGDEVNISNYSKDRLLSIRRLGGGNGGLCDNFASTGSKPKEQLEEEEVLKSVGIDITDSKVTQFTELGGKMYELTKQAQSSSEEDRVGLMAQIEQLNVQRDELWASLDDGLTDEQVETKGQYALQPYSAVPTNSKVNPASCALSHSNYNNSARGAFSIPDVGAEVWCFFEGGDITFPVVWGNAPNADDYASTYNVNSPTPDYPEAKDGEEANIHRGKFSLNERGGSMEIVSTTGRERVKFTHYRGGTYEMNQLGTSELAIGQKTFLAKGDYFKTVNGDYMQSIDYDKEVIVKGDITEYVGDVRNDYKIAQKIKEAHKPIHDHQQLFDLKRTDNTYELDASPLQEKSGNNTPCPVCSGEGKFPTIVSTKSKFTDATDSGKKEKIDSGTSKVVEVKEDTKHCLNCSGTGVSPWTAEGEYDFDQRKKDIPDLINNVSAEVSDLENRLSSGGHLTQYIGKSQTVMIGGPLNDLTSIRVDPQGKRVKLGEYSSESGKGVFPLYDAVPHVEQVATNNLVGGDYIMQCANKYELMTGANGISMKTLGPMTLQGRIMTISADQLNISSNNEVTVDGGRSFNATGDSITLSPRTQTVGGQQMKSIALDATVSTSGNQIVKGGTLNEGELFVQHMTAPKEYQESEVTLNMGAMRAGVEIGRVVGNKVFSVAAKDATVVPTRVVYATQPMTLVETNDDLRRTASAVNGAQPVMAQPIENLKARGTGYNPYRYFNPDLFELFSDCDDKDLIDLLDKFYNEEITAEELREQITSASESPISQTARSNKGCDPCE